MLIYSNTSESEQLAEHIRIILRGGAILHPELASYLLNTHLTPPTQIAQTHPTALATSAIAYSPIEIQIFDQFAHTQTLNKPHHYFNFLLLKSVV